MPLVTDAMLTQARAWQASIMTDTVTLEAYTGETLDDWGTATPVWSEVYAGPGLVQVDTTRPATDPFDEMSEKFLSVNNPKLLELVRKAPAGEKEKLLLRLQKNFTDLGKLIEMIEEN